LPAPLTTPWWNSSSCARTVPAAGAVNTNCMTPSRSPSPLSYPQVSRIARVVSGARSGSPSADDGAARRV